MKITRVSIETTWSVDIDNKIYTMRYLELEEGRYWSLIDDDTLDTLIEVNKENDYENPLVPFLLNSNEEETATFLYNEYKNR